MLGVLEGQQEGGGCGWSKGQRCERPGQVAGTGLHPGTAYSRPSAGSPFQKEQCSGAQNFRDCCLCPPRPRRASGYTDCSEGQLADG